MNDEERAFCQELLGHLRRIANAFERVSPPPPDRSKVTPAGPDALKRPTLVEQAEWERDDAAALRNRS